MAANNPFTPPQPRTAFINSGTTFTWNDGTTPFNGYLLLGLTIPNVPGGSIPWPDFTANTASSNLPLPGFTMIPIVDGLPYTTVGVIWNADINPPTTQYVAWLLDSSRAYIVGPTAAFTVAANPFSVPTLTPLLPSTSNAPVHD